MPAGGGGLEMKANKLWGTLFATMIGLAMTASSSDVEAQTKKKPAAAGVASVPATTKKVVELEPSGLAWGMPMKQVAALYDKVLDEDYKPRYQKVSPGVKMRELDAALAEEKATFRRSRIDFGKLPTAVDASPLKGEYSYQNKESLMTLTRNGQTRHFFFIQDRLWKVIDEVKLDGGALGKNLQEAAVKMSSKFGAPGRVIPPNEDAGIFITTVDWKDSKTHVRLMERSDTAVAVAYEDSATLANIDNLRTNKPKQEEAIDPAVAAAIRGAEPPPPPPPPDDKNKKK
jgi:hypothetical protein